MLELLNSKLAKGLFSQGDGQRIDLLHQIRYANHGQQAIDKLAQAFLAPTAKLNQMQAQYSVVTEKRLLWESPHPELV